MNHAMKAWSFLIAISITLIVFGHILLGREGLLIGLLLSLGVNCYVYFFEDQRVVKRFPGQHLEGQDPWKLLSSARRLAAKMHIPLPKIIVLDSSTPQALVVGRNLSHGTIILSEALLKNLNHREIEAVLAYSMASIKNLNTLAFAVASFIANLFLVITGALDFCLRLLIVEKKNPKSTLSQFFTRLAAPLVGLLVRLAVRPNAYLAADSTAAQCLEHPKALADAIWKLHAYANTLPTETELSFAHMFVVNPLTQHSWKRFFHAQPQIETRIRGLVGYYPL